MFCTRCGQPVTDDSVFCPHCGNALSGSNEPQSIPPSPVMPGAELQPPVYPMRSDISPQGYYASPQSYGEPRIRKKKTGLAVGLSVGAVVVLAVAAVLFFVWPGFLKTVSVAGIWYSDSRGEVIEFSAGHSFDAYTYYGDFDGDYEFDKTMGKGHIEMSDDREFDFSMVNNGQLYVQDMGVFTKADNRFDINDFVDDAINEFGEE